MIVVSDGKGPTILDGLMTVQITTFLHADGRATARFVDTAERLDALYLALKDFPEARFAPGGVHLKTAAWNALLNHREAIHEAAYELRMLRSQLSTERSAEPYFSPPRMQLGALGQGAGDPPIKNGETPALAGRPWNLG